MSIKNIFKFYILLFWLNNLSLNSFAQIVQSEGLVNLHAMADPEDFKRYTWFKDSLVIFEVFEYTSETIDENVVFAGSRVKNYSILDLKTRRAQDYLTFADTAKPVNNYLIKPNETISWNFYNNNQFYDKYIDSLIPLSDTILNGIECKQFWFFNTGTGWKQKITLFLAKNNFENIFHLSNSIDKLYPGYKLTYVKTEESNNGNSYWGSLISLRNKLTDNEKNIFKIWSDNILKCELPITTLTEAKKELAKYSKSITNTYHR